MSGERMEIADVTPATMTAVARLLREAANAESVQKSFAPMAKRHAAKWLEDAARILSPDSAP